MIDFLINITADERIVELEEIKRAHIRDIVGLRANLSHDFLINWILPILVGILLYPIFRDHVLKELDQAEQDRT